jgi:hypothetical protein
MDLGRVLVQGIVFGIPMIVIGLLFLGWVLS